MLLCEISGEILASQHFLRESKKPESEDECSFPLRLSLKETEPHRCYVVCTYMPFILCMYIYIC